jgi:hypothetical protein
MDRASRVVGVLVVSPGIQYRIVVLALICGGGCEARAARKRDQIWSVGAGAIVPSVAVCVACVVACYRN